MYLMNKKDREIIDVVETIAIQQNERLVFFIIPKKGKFNTTYAIDVFGKRGFISGGCGYDKRENSLREFKSCIVEYILNPRKISKESLIIEEIGWTDNVVAYELKIEK